MAQRSLDLTGLLLLAVAALGFKCSPRAGLDSEHANTLPVVAAVGSRSTPPLRIEPSYVDLNRARRFSEARDVLSAIAPERAQLPAYRFVNAFLAVRANEGSRALSLLEGLSEQLPDLRQDVDRVRAEAQLQTAEALVGAAWLATHGRSGAWLAAAYTLERINQPEGALIAVDKGLAALEQRNGSRSPIKIAEHRWLRAKLHEQAQRTHPFLEDLRWLAVETPNYAQARERIAQALDDAKLVLDAAQRLQRLKRLAEAGWVERLDLELGRAQRAGAVNPALQAYLRGRVRQVARVEQIAGAQLLIRAAELNYEDPSRLRIDAARLYVREGDVERALHTYDSVARQRRDRSIESQFYAARAAATLGQPRQAVERYTRFIQRFPVASLRKVAEFERALTLLLLKEHERAELELSRLLTSDLERDERPLLLELQGLAAQRLGKQPLAATRWQNVVRTAPLSLGGALAQLRLRELDAESSTAAVGDAAPSASPKALDDAAPSARAKALDDAAPSASPKALDDKNTGAPPPDLSPSPNVPASNLPSSPNAPPPDLTPRPSAPPSLSRRVNQLLAFGLDEMAADAHRAEEEQVTTGTAESCCRNWQAIGYGPRVYSSSRKIRGELELSEGVSDGSRWRWECRFPRPYAALVREFEREYRLPSELLFAIMRQESGFDPEIVSPANAVGLMQLLPRTAQRIAEEVHYTGELRLEEPRTNLRLGAAYLRKLLDVFEQNLVLAVAAYNAGPAAVSLWLKHAKHGSVELFAARIPYQETQKYVERVCLNLMVYRHLNGLERHFDGLSLDLPQELKDSSSLY
ncbi:MAG TPA: transglycosylase SLT domain-containing protein [Polyangiaceae bacterium]|nr:transglycosylase SLT domain-containing protein [Polyangiaceae bacterium]